MITDGTQMKLTTNFKRKLGNEMSIEKFEKLQYILGDLEGQAHGQSYALDVDIENSGLCHSGVLPFPTLLPLSNPFAPNH